MTSPSTEGKLRELLLFIKEMDLLPMAFANEQGKEVRDWLDEALSTPSQPVGGNNGEIASKCLSASPKGLVEALERIARNHCDCIFRPGSGKTHEDWCVKYIAQQALERFGGGETTTREDV